MTAPRIQLDTMPNYPLSVASEAVARQAADLVLQGQIDTLNTEVALLNNSQATPGSSDDGLGQGGGTTTPVVRSSMTPYLGQVATNCVVPTNANQAYTQFNSRSRHKMMDDVVQLQCAFPNWNVATSANPGPSAGYGGVEHTNGQPVRIRASIEYPVGTFRRLLFGGKVTGDLADGGTLLSDPCDIAIPNGAFFYVRTYWSCPNGGLVWANDKDANNGEAFSYGVGGIPDKSISGTITDGAITNGSDNGVANAFIYRPCAIVAMTSRRSVALYGDSRINNYQDLYTNDSSASRGAYMRSLADNFAYISTACGGDRLAWFLANSTRRAALAKYCSHILIEYGINDVNQSGSTVAAITQNLTALYALFRGLGGKQPIFQATYEPYTSSSDSWTSYAGQTPAGNETIRTGVNDAIRAGLGQDVTLDTADVFEDGRNSGRWITGQVDGAVTVDGLHEGYIGALWMKNVAHIKPALFTFY